MNQRYMSKFKKAKDYLSMEAPGIWVLMQRFKIELDKEALSAYLDPKEVSIVIPERWMDRISEAELASLIAHEALHGVLGHWIPPREYNLDSRKWNLACDVEVNQILEEMELLRNLEIMTERLLNAKPVTWRLFVSYDVNPKDPAETVYAKIKDKEINFNSVNPQGEHEGSGKVLVPLDLGGGSGGKRETIWRGDEEFIREIKEVGEVSSESTRKVLARALAEMIEAQKNAGNVPASLLRKLKKFLGSEVPWYRVLRNALREGMGSTVRTWQRPNRRVIDGVPGNVNKGASIWCLVDTSASISDEELAKFAGEVAAASKYASKVHILSWDAKTYETIRASSPSRVKHALANFLKGGGGTVASEPMKKVLTRMRSGDAVIVLTDGWWFDSDQAELVSLMRSVKRRASTAVLLTTDIIPKAAEEAKWLSIRLKKIEEYSEEYPEV